MDPRLKASALWGLVGALAFLVLAQAYRLFGGDAVGYPVLFGVAAVVLVSTAGVTYATDGWLARKRRV